MKIKSINLKNYKSLRDTETITLNYNVNVFAGKNNTGKTAFIEAIYKIVNARIGDVLFDELYNYTNLEMEIVVNDEELDFINNEVSLDLQIIHTDSLIINLLFDVLNNNVYVKSINKCILSENIPFYINKSKGKLEKDLVSGTISHALLNAGLSMEITGGRPKVIDNIVSLLKQKIVFISGNRNFPRQENAEIYRHLNTDGTNLNAFLYTLHNNYEFIYEKIRDNFKQIFTDVSLISTPVNDEKLTNISLCFNGSNETFPLYDCGSGFTHVLLFLCVLFTKENSVILFDEPHVFLHPSAEKAIYDVICENNHHQYVLTTHSPILINYQFDKSIFIVKKEYGYSSYTPLKNIQEILSEIGINNSDFALADKVLFVEGETEEAIIPIILNHLGIKQIGYNYRILKMEGTGKDFIKKSTMSNNKKKLDLILSGISNSPIPYKILIDSDEKSEEKIKEIKNKYEDNVLVLERREIENYLLDCYEELAEVININTGEKSSTPESIQIKVEELLQNVENKYLYPKVNNNQLKNVVGSRVLELLFEEYKLTYNKVIHGVQITKFVLNNCPDKFKFLIELRDFIERESFIANL